MEADVDADQNFYSRGRPRFDDHAHPHQQLSPHLHSALPPLTTANLDSSANGPATTTNGYGVAAVDDPEFFYTQSHAVTDSYNDSYDSYDDDMATTSSRPTTSVRPSVNGTKQSTALHSSATIRGRPAYRSASAPIDPNRPKAGVNGQSHGYTKSPRPSVKDLLQKFDQNTEPTTSTRSYAVGRPGMAGGRYTPSRENQTLPRPKGVSPVGSSPSGARSSPRPQRNRYAVEDQHSNNALSSVPRTRTRNISANPPATRSSTNSSATGSFAQKASQAQAKRKPLFGEVVTNGSGSEIAYGIERSRRRTSDSSLHPRLAGSDLDTPSSPTAWYRGFNEENESATPRSTSHGRSQSDQTSFKSTTRDSNKLVKSPPSRIPLMTTHLSDSSPSSSPTDSPLTRAAPAYTSKLRKAEPQQRRADSRSQTPVSSSLPKPTGYNRRAPPASNNKSLNAYISSPPPRNSPPLRSSRPRLPVSAASTASSRARQADNYGYTPPRATSRQEEKRDRKVVDIGPVDFAARRERIVRQYTKSIHESKEVERRREELRRSMVVRKAEEEKRKARAEVPSEDNNDVATPIEVEHEAHDLHVETIPLQSDTLTPPQSTVTDSPTLGIPGSFPEPSPYIEEPQSAVSNDSETTEIDNEPQPDTDRIPEYPLRKSLHASVPGSFPDQGLGLYINESTVLPDEHHDRNDHMSIRIALDTLNSFNPPAEERTNDTESGKQMNVSEPVEVAQDYDTCDSLESSMMSQPTADVPVQYQEEVEPTVEPAFEEPTFEEATLQSPAQVPEDTHVEVEPVTAQIAIGMAMDVPADRSEVDDESCSEIEPESTETILQESNPRISVAEVPTSQLVEIRTALNTDLQSPQAVTEVDYDSSGMDDSSLNREYSNSLQVSSQLHRNSQHSIWTDYSIETDDPELSPRPRLPMFSFESRSNSDLDRPEPPPKTDAFQPAPSPRTSMLAHRTSPAKPRYVNTSGGADVELPMISPGKTPSIASNSSIPYWSDHAPPPIPKGFVAETSDLTQSPTSSTFKRPTSGVWKPSYSRASQDDDSRRPSEDAYSPMPSISTRRSSAQISSEGTLAMSESQIEVDSEEVKKEKKRLFKRGNIIGELIETESSYLKDMHVVVEIYKGTAEACPKLESDDVRAIFRNIDQVVAFTTGFVEALRKAGSIYAPSKSRKSLKKSTPGKVMVAGTLEEVTDEKDRQTSIGAAFMNYLKQMEIVYSDFLKSSENANTRLTTLSKDPAVRVWLDECVQAAQDLTNAWSLDALLVKPVQRITRYQLFLKDIMGSTPDDHPDRKSITEAHDGIINLLKGIDELKKRIHTVEKIVTRKRKESDVRSGLAKLVTRQARKYQTGPESRASDDQSYLKLHERYSDDFLRLQVVLRDVEFYTRQVSTFVKDWLRFLSGIEQMVRFKPSQYHELESKWVRFNMSMRDMETVVLETHVNAVRKKVIEPFETLIKSYGPPAVAMSKRAKRRVDFDKANHLKSQGKKVDEKLNELVEQYDALNETLKLELPKLSKLTEIVANLSLVHFVNLQTDWWGIWVEKVKAVLEDGLIPGDATEIMESFNRDFVYGEAKMKELGIVNGSFKARADYATSRTSQSTTLVESGTTRSSQSTTRDDDSSIISKGRPSNLTTRTRESSVSDVSPSLPTPDFLRSNGHFNLSPMFSNAGPPAWGQLDSRPSNGQSAAASPATPDWYRQPSFTRPDTIGSIDSVSNTRGSFDSTTRSARQSGSYNVEPPASTRPMSGLFVSALPPDEREDRLSMSREADPVRSYNVLYLAASLFEFNMDDTKIEAGYPYLTYQAGEIFDVIGEKGELWLAKNQDDPSDWVGWIWSKHFARLAD